MNHTPFAGTYPYSPSGAQREYTEHRRAAYQQPGGSPGTNSVCLLFKRWPRLQGRGTKNDIYVRMEDLFSLHDVVIRTTGSSRELLDKAADALLYKGAERMASMQDPPDLTLSLVQDALIPSAPADAEVTGSFGTDFHILHDDATFIARGPNVYAAVRPFEREAEVTFTAATGAVEAFYGLAFALTTLLKVKGFFGLHAAALVRGNRGLLLVASSDSGKSTAALTLVRQGWQYVTDDALLVRERDEGVVGLSFRRDFCVDQDAAAHFPELHDHEWAASPSDPTKWRVALEELYPGRHVRKCIPHIVAFPALSSAFETRLEPIDQRPAFEHLMAESAALATPLPEWIRAQMDLSSRLIAQSRCYRLKAGRDVLEAPEQFSAILTEALLSESE